MALEIENHIENEEECVPYGQLRPYTLFELDGERYVTLLDEDSETRDLCLGDGLLSSPPAYNEEVIKIKEYVDVKITTS